MPATIYWCGYNYSAFAILLFGTAQHWKNGGCRSNSNDVLVLGAYGPCECHPEQFAGRILSINGEDSQPAPPSARTLQIGAGAYPFPYGAVVWIEKNLTQFTGPVTIDAVAYAASNCVQQRERMVEELARHVPVHAFGSCTGNGKARRMMRPGSWPSNTRHFRGYAFVLAAEHGFKHGYITEKPFIAAAAGAVPIYWGDPSISGWMNPERILMWGPTTPQTVKRLLKTGLRKMRALPAVNTNNLIARAQALLPLLRRRAP